MEKEPIMCVDTKDCPNCTENQTTAKRALEWEREEEKENEEERKTTRALEERAEA